jgi:mevalonate kinase
MGMSVEARSFPGKILLFGEYTVLQGSAALAFPYEKYFGKWSESSVVDARLLNWADQLAEIIGLPAKVEAFKLDIKEGLVFDSSIKGGYGLGSSGALTAGFFHRYGVDIDSLDTETLRNWMAAAEAVFHGRSSGIDPLVSYMGAPILFQTKKGATLIEWETPNIDAFLLDSGATRETQALVSVFRQKMEEDRLFFRAMEELAVAQDNAIQYLIQGEIDNFWTSVRLISEYQWEHLRWLIPISLHDVFKSGIDNPDYVVKLCGAGGGGYFLSFTKKGTNPPYGAIEKVSW